MENLLDILAVTFIFGGGSLFLLAISPVGKAIADRIRGAGKGLPNGLARQIEESQLALLDEIEGLRQELSEVQERLDFTERLLVREREAPQLPQGEEVGQ
ncbi:MAG: hypothetical protein JSW43_03495 [Gemmatimonadota bacterium]|nr:MAG: hypothetical protein JSW43_03495 [Gemmatimonadota bacterium]